MKVVTTAGLLSGYTGILVSTMSEVHEVLDVATGYTLFTHQLPDAFAAAKPILEAQFPWLADLEMPVQDDGEAQQAWVDRLMAFVQTVVDEWGEHQALRSPAEIGRTIDFIPPTLASMMRPDQGVIAVVLD